ncbi:hypothetical protein CROQUDRAFT_101387 [Cronartium quercuum f. sp. fusiforme G11]|uniref:Nudix hydrolase domain-containing protein n=1 Tax=Cronartium quercuum f. sp. fusiforme G11 TaxID=708437 RepID=A0A9P6N970_9BASI|nr:hypothetical protein CROQUDRAFT_101387 [Cronartium quercuum f. sp. fusiforme G11]
MTSGISVPPPSHLLSALLAIHRTPPALISAPTQSTLNPASRKPPSPAATPLVGPARHVACTRRASVAIIIRIRPRNCSTSSPLSSPPSSPASVTSSPSDHQDLFPQVSPASPPPIMTNLPEAIPSLAHRPASALDIPKALRQFFAQPWISGGQAEIFFIKRAARSTDRWSSHLAFPGGRMEPEDEDGMFCALRETWEEVGIDLADRRSFMPIGRLDDREITTSLGKRLLMVLSPYVFLSTCPANEGPEPDLEPNEVESAYWVPIDELVGPRTRWGEVVIDLSSRLAPGRGWFVKKALNLLVGSMRFQSILLKNTPCAVASGQAEGSHRPLKSGPVDCAPTDLNLWGLTLGMTLDLITFFTDPGVSTATTADHPPRSIRSSPSLSMPSPTQLFRSPSLPRLDHLNQPPPSTVPSLSSIFPRFSHADINALIYLLGARYRALLHIIHQPPSQRRYRSAGRLALNAFYTAVRKALIVAIVLRSSAALLIVVGLLLRLKRRLGSSA